MIKVQLDAQTKVLFGAIFFGFLYMIFIFSRGIPQNRINTNSVERQCLDSDMYTYDYKTWIKCPENKGI